MRHYVLKTIVVSFPEHSREGKRSLMASPSILCLDYHLPLIASVNEHETKTGFKRETNGKLCFLSVM